MYKLTYQFLELLLAGEGILDIPRLRGVTTPLLFSAEKGRARAALLQQPSRAMKLRQHTHTKQRTKQRKNGGQEGRGSCHDIFGEEGMDGVVVIIFFGGGIDFSGGLQQN